MILKQDNIKAGQGGSGQVRASQGVSREVKACQGESRRVRSSKFLGGIWVLMVLMLMGLTGCINDAPFYKEEPEGPDATLSGDFYLSINVNVPSENSTRSETNEDGGSTSGTTSGSDNENKINSASLYFFDATTHSQVCRFFAYKQLDYKQGDLDKSQWTITAKIEPSELRELIGKKLHLYILANTGYPVLATGGNDEENFQNSIFTVSAMGSIPVQEYGTGGQICPMANWDFFEIDALEGKSAEGKKDYELYEVVKELFTQDRSDGGKLWKINDTSNLLSLERQIARIDYKDGSTLVNQPYLYKLDNATYQSGEENKDVYLKIVAMQLFNVNKEAYTFRHTQYKRTASEEESEVEDPEDGSDDETEKVAEDETPSFEPGVDVFGKERDNKEGYYNWIVSSDWSKKNSGSEFSFFNQMSSSTEEEKTVWDYNNKPTGGYITMANLNAGRTDYTPWYYITENTVPSTEKMTLQYSTGIEFRVLVCDAEGNPVEGSEGTTLRINLDGGKFKEIEWSEGINQTDDEGNETPIEPAGFYVNYRYLIQHNIPDSKKNNNKTSGMNGETGKIEGTLAPMQIGVVRNNVYQLSVTGIKSLPDPHEPDNQYLSVAIKILAWAKRDINVKF